MSVSVDVTEAPLLRVPFESLKRAAKDRKALVDALADAVAALTQERQPPPADQQQQVQVDADAARGDADGDKAMAEAAGAGPSSREQGIARLDDLLAQLQGVKRKLSEVSIAERDDCQRCKARLEHLLLVGTPARDAILPWTKQRLDRILVDHLLRQGCYDAAASLVHAGGLQHLVDSNIFMEARKVVDALRARDTGLALAWCAENQARLRKIKSKLEFKLHVQQFIELVRGEQRVAAIAYARQHLAPWASQYMSELQRAVATLVFTSKTRCPQYRALFDDSQWDGLVELFRRELYRIHFLTPESLLTVYLQSGLSALKTPVSFESEGGSREDPLRLPAFQQLSKGLPFSKHVHSKLVCSITKETMSDDNPPVVLPNGYVYSQKGVAAVMARNGGQMRCPRTGTLFAPEELRRAYIV